jgi:hypothetical protein
MSEIVILLFLITKVTCYKLAGTAGLLLDDGQRLLPYNRDRDTGRPILRMKNVAGRVPETQLRYGGVFCIINSSTDTARALDSSCGKQ